DGSRAVLPRSLSFRHHLLDFLDARKHRGKLHELRFRQPRDDLGQRRLSGSRRSPENQRPSIVSLNLTAERLPWSDQVFLSYKLIQHPRAHSVRQRTALAYTVIARNRLKKTHDLCLPTLAHLGTAPARVGGGQLSLSCRLVQHDAGCYSCIERVHHRRMRYRNNLVNSGNNIP